MGEYDTGQVDENSDPIMASRPNGLDIDSPWARWPVVDDDDQVQVIAPAGPAIVAMAKDLDAAPSAGRDFGDPSEIWEDQDLGAGTDPETGLPILTPVLVSPYHTVPLGLTATRTIETWIGMEEDELIGSTRAECIRAITADENAAIGCTWGAAKVGARCWPATTKQVRRFRRREDRTWYDGLNLAQRNFIRALTDEQKDELRATPIADRAALLTSWV